MFHSWLWFAKEIAEEISPKADCSRWLDAQAWYLPFDLPMLPSKDILMKLWDQDKPRSVESVPILSDFNVVSLASYSTFSFWWQAHGRGAAEVPCTNTERKEKNQLKHRQSWLHGFFVANQLAGLRNCFQMVDGRKGFDLAFPANPFSFWITSHDLPAIRSCSGALHAEAQDDFWECRDSWSLGGLADRSMHSIISIFPKRSEGFPFMAA